MALPPARLLGSACNSLALPVNLIRLVAEEPH